VLHAQAFYDAKDVVATTLLYRSATTMVEDVQTKAIALARLGLRVFPCCVEKRPTIERWPDRATTDYDEIVDWCWRDRLIGVRTGLQPDGWNLAVLDIDVRHNGHFWLREHDNQLRTRCHTTRSRGYHLLFASQEPVRNSAGKIAVGVDVRGEGGYVIWWPAAGLEVKDDTPLDQLAEWPLWLTSPKPRETSPECRGEACTGVVPTRGAVLADTVQIERLARFVGESVEGARNNRLYWAAARAAELHYIRPERRYEAAGQLIDAAVRTGLDQREAERTVASAMGWGARR
jgi:hypothetical protein